MAKPKSGRLGQTFRGSNRIRNEMRRIVAINSEKFDAIIRNFARRVRYKLTNKPYPPDFPENTYSRTGDLGTGFKTEKQGVAHYGVTNKMWYAALVIGNDSEQAYMHKPGYKGRQGWWQMDKEIEKQLPDLRESIAERVEELWLG